MTMIATAGLSLWALVIIAWSPIIPAVTGSKCSKNGPSVQQTQVGFGNPPRFVVEVKNNCPMCPATDIHVKCGSFPQKLVDPGLLKFLSFDDCVVNGGFPLGPMQKLSFNYTHQKFTITPKAWYFQCE